LRKSKTQAIPPAQQLDLAKKTNGAARFSLDANFNAWLEQSGVVLAEGLSLRGRTLYANKVCAFVYV